MEVTKTINKQEIEFWTWRGFVNAIWGDTKASGGGSEKSQRRAASDASRADAKSSIEIRVVGDDGSRRTVTLPASAQAAPGDDVTLLYGRKAAQGKGPLLGIVNHTDRKTWATLKGAGPLDYRHPFPLGLVQAMKRYTLFGVAFALSGCTLIAIHLQMGRPLSLWLWAVIGICELAALWLVSLLAGRRQKIIEQMLLGEVETLLRRISLDPARVSPAPDEA